MSLEEIVLRHAINAPLDTLNREAAAAGVMMMPIVGRGRIKAILGLRRSSRRPMIEDIEMEARVGDVLIPLPEGANYPGFIFARGNDPAEVESALREGLVEDRVRPLAVLRSAVDQVAAAPPA